MSIFSVTSQPRHHEPVSSVSWLLAVAYLASRLAIEVSYVVDPLIILFGTSEENMALLNQVTITEIIFPAIVVAGVLIGAVLVFVFGFKNAEEPQFDKLPILVDDRKASSKKRKTKEKVFIE